MVTAPGDRGTQNPAYSPLSTHPAGADRTPARDRRPPARQSGRPPRPAPAAEYLGHWMARLLCISDLHVASPRNRAFVERIEPRPDDWLVVAGDVGETVAHLEWAMG